MRNLQIIKGIVMTFAVMVLGFAGIVLMSGDALAQKQSGRKILSPEPSVKVPLDDTIFSNFHRDLVVDISENGNRFVFDETPVHQDGSPAYGNEFVTEGYIYPGGTLNGSNGVNPDGSPEFPNRVIGRWTCRGWHVGEGAHTETGPWVITHQYFDFGRTFGSRSITNEGYELVDMNVPFKRAVTGGTGIFKNAKGDSTQVFLGFNRSNGVVLRVRFHDILNIFP